MQNKKDIQEITLAEKKRAKAVYKLLVKMYPHVPQLFLEYTTDAQMLCAIILSAQSTDAQVNKVTKGLFTKYKTAHDFAHAKRTQFEKEIRSTGYYKQKAKNVIGCFKLICQKYGGRIPLTMEELIALPGVGRKTANLVLASKGIVQGIAVDTHVWRLAQRLGFTSFDTQDRIEKDLLALFDKSVWHEINGLFISHGRAVCAARNPQCAGCILHKKGVCPRIGVIGK